MFFVLVVVVALVVLVGVEKIPSFGSGWLSILFFNNVVVVEVDGNIVMTIVDLSLF